MVLVFDVNETLLDLGEMRPHFERVFGDGGVLEEWFGLLLRQAMVATIIERYRPFDVLARGALGMLAGKYDVVLGENSKQTIIKAMTQLPPHPDVFPALSRLQDAGYRMATLTNNPHEMLVNQLGNAGLDQFFNEQLSVEDVRQFKPAAEVYHFAAARLGVPISKMMMVAAHDWDVLGAMRAGAKGAFVARPSAMWEDAAEKADVTGSDLNVIARWLLTENQF